jgi:hypothetical protein
MTTRLARPAGAARRIRETGQGNGLRLYAGDVAAYFEGEQVTSGVTKL